MRKTFFLAVFSTVLSSTQSAFAMQDVVSNINETLVGQVIMRSGNAGGLDQLRALFKEINEKTARDPILKSKKELLDWIEKIIKNIPKNLRDMNHENLNALLKKLLEDFIQNTDNHNKEKLDIFDKLFDFINSNTNDTEHANTFLKDTFPKLDEFATRVFQVFLNQKEIGEDNKCKFYEAIHQKHQDLQKNELNQIMAEAEALFENKAKDTENAKKQVTLLAQIAQIIAGTKKIDEGKAAGLVKEFVHQTITHFSEINKKNIKKLRAKLHKKKIHAAKPENEIKIDLKNLENYHSKNNITIPTEYPCATNPMYDESMVDFKSEHLKFGVINGNQLVIQLIIDICKEISLLDANDRGEQLKAFLDTMSWIEAAANKSVGEEDDLLAADGDYLTIEKIKGYFSGEDPHRIYKTLLHVHEYLLEELHNKSLLKFDQLNEAEQHKQD